MGGMICHESDKVTLPIILHSPPPPPDKFSHEGFYGNDHVRFLLSAYTATSSDGCASLSIDIELLSLLFLYLNPHSSICIVCKCSIIHNC